jgi:hypothetical protein
MRLLFRYKRAIILTPAIFFVIMQQAAEVGNRSTEASRECVLNWGMGA